MSTINPIQAERLRADYWKDRFWLALTLLVTTNIGWIINFVLWSIRYAGL